MSKELTEKWKNGKLTFGKMYWCCDKEKNIAKLVNINKKFFEWDIATEVTKDVKEVLAPIPNYEEFKRLQEQLKEANELLLDFCSNDECRFDHNGYCQEHDSCEGGYKCIQKDLKQYLEKWGVK